VEAEKMRSYGKTINDDFRARYSRCILDLESMNKEMAMYLDGIQQYCLEASENEIFQFTFHYLIKLRGTKFKMFSVFLVIMKLRHILFVLLDCSGSWIKSNDCTRTCTRVKSSRSFASC